MRQRMVLLVLATLVLSTVPMRGAEASCMAPQATFAILPGAQVPPNARIHFLAPGWVEKETTFSARVQDGRRVSLSVEMVTQEFGYRVYRLTLDQKTAATVTLAATRPGGSPLEVEVVVDPEWVPPSAAAPGVKEVEARDSSWVCSYTRTASIELADDRPLFEVQWAPGQAAWARGERHTLVMPFTVSAFFGWSRARNREDPKPALPFGHSSCFGHTFEWSSPTIVVQFAALNLDGSKSKSTAPLTLQRPERLEVDPSEGRQGRAAVETFLRKRYRGKAPSRGLVWKGAPILRVHRLSKKEGSFTILYRSTLRKRDGGEVRALFEVADSERVEAKLFLLATTLEAPPAKWSDPFGPISCSDWYCERRAEKVAKTLGDLFPGAKIGRGTRAGSRYTVPVEFSEGKRRSVKEFHFEITLETVRFVPTRPTR